jgi:A/G-specific adenine glycosylase
VNSRYPVDRARFQRELITWGHKHFRAFPWRLTKDPYRILIAEVMLHRTQASQVVPVYELLTELCPDVHALAQLRKKKLSLILYPLGLHWRIDLIYEMVRDIAKRFDRQIPHGKAALLSLPGVNEYIASAVRCFAWNQNEPLIDTNTVRIIGRLYGLEVKDSSRRNPVFRDLITNLVDSRHPRDYNYALLDLADEVCTKKRMPDCKRCPILKWCAYGTASITVR